jgi:hypothetical protein
MSNTPLPSDLDKIETPKAPAAVDQVEREKFEFDKKIRLSGVSGWNRRGKEFRRQKKSLDAVPELSCGELSEARPQMA